MFLPLAPLVLLLENRTTGLVVDCGYWETVVTPVNTGVCMESMSTYSPIAGARILSYLKELSKSEYPNANEIPLFLWENACRNALLVSCGQACESDFRCRIGGKEIVIRAQTRTEATEILFKESLDVLNVPDAVAKTLEKCSTGDRAAYMSNIILSGGVCNIPGFKKRLLMSLEKKRACVQRMHENAYYLNKARIAHGRYPRDIVQWAGGKKKQNASNALGSLYAVAEARKWKSAGDCPANNS